MHGRLKVKTTAEQQEAKRKEREKKLKIYNAAVGKVFTKRANKEYDQEALHITAEILTANSDFYTLWNYRKEIFLKLKEEKAEEEMITLFQQELYFLESCLKGNPKSYGTWHHRCFVLDNCPKPDWDRELQLCNKFLEYDERNFHCWDYRRFVVSRSKVTPQSEFDFTTAKISSNFSNYSSWHYRSKLLPVIFPDPGHHRGIQETQLLEEHETVQNAFFTDPDDQSAWFYHRWLLGRGERSQQITQMYASRESRRVIISFAKPIQVGESSRLMLEMNGSSVDCTWKNQLKKTSYSTLWIASDVDLPDEDVKVKVTVEESEHSAEVILSQGQKCIAHNFGSKAGNFRDELSSATSDVLHRELEAVQELYVLEPDNKWTMLTIVLLMKALNPVSYKDEILLHLQQLQDQDDKRKNYYRDFRSKMLIENKIESLGEKMDGTTDFSDQDLSCMAHLELLPLVTEINLEKNKICDLHNFQYLQCVHKLNAANNSISSCSGLEHLTELAELDLRNNCICTVEDMEMLASCPKLRTVYINGNPVCDNEDDLRQLKNKFINVKFDV